MNARVILTFLLIAFITKPYLLHGEQLNSSSELAAEGIVFDKSIVDQHDWEKERPARPTSIESLTEMASVGADGPDALSQTETQQAPLRIISLDDKMPPDEEDEEDTRRLNLASSDDGAQIISSNTECKWPERAIDDWEDSYVMNPCAASKWLIVELSQLGRVDAIELTMKEMYSSRVKEFVIKGRQSHPKRDHLLSNQAASKGQVAEAYSKTFSGEAWSHLGAFTANNTKGTQLFSTLPAARQVRVRYILVQFLSHYGQEEICALNSIRVLGVTAAQELEAALSGGLSSSIPMPPIATSSPPPSPDPPLSAGLLVDSSEEEKDTDPTENDTNSTEKDTNSTDAQPLTTCPVLSKLLPSRLLSSMGFLASMAPSNKIPLINESSTNESSHDRSEPSLILDKIGPLLNHSNASKEANGATLETDTASSAVGSQPSDEDPKYSKAAPVNETTAKTGSGGLASAPPTNANGARNESTQEAPPSKPSSSPPQPVIDPSLPSRQEDPSAGGLLAGGGDALTKKGLAGNLFEVFKAEFLALKLNQTRLTQHLNSLVDVLNKNVTKELHAALKNIDALDLLTKKMNKKLDKVFKDYSSASELRSWVGLLLNKTEQDGLKIVWLQKEVVQMRNEAMARDLVILVIICILIFWRAKAETSQSTRSEPSATALKTVKKIKAGSKKAGTLQPAREPSKHNDSARDDADFSDDASTVLIPENEAGDSSEVSSRSVIKTTSQHKWSGSISLVALEWTAFVAFLLLVIRNSTDDEV